MSSLRSRSDFESYWPPCGPADIDSRKLTSDNDLRDRVDTVVRKRSLTRTIKTEVIPRLLMAHRQPAAVTRPSRSARVHGDDVVEFARLLVAHEAEIAHEFVLAKRAQGTTLEAVFIDLFEPAARHLGVLW